MQLSEELICIEIRITIDKIWSIGGDTGWYSYTWLWKIRGYVDKMVGGVGLRRGRTHSTYLEPGDPLDFWRVLLADKEEKRLLLKYKINKYDQILSPFH